jgi:drug/metabolite transporter (DMT)-like permease
MKKSRSPISGANPKHRLQPGVAAAFTAALLFGGSTPIAKWLMSDMSPWLLAALLYLGSGLGLALYRLVGRCHGVKLALAEWPCFLVRC